MRDHGPSTCPGQAMAKGTFFFFFLGTFNPRPQVSALFQTGHLGTDWLMATEGGQVPG